MKYIIDYFQFVIKPNKLSFDFRDVLALLDISDLHDNFECWGPKYHYSNLYVYDCIRIYTPSSERLDDMGYMIELSGQGCRFIENHFKMKYDTEFDWKIFALRLKSLTEAGFVVSMNRVDFAYDDFNGVLDLSVIEQAAVNHEFVSLFRNHPKHNDYHDKTTVTLLEWSQFKDLSKDKVSHTIYFGSKRSNTFCKFYDKLEEQRVKFKNNKEKLNTLEHITHWVRFEFTFKRKQANSVIASMCELSEKDFSVYLSEVINGYIRFINRDDSNPTRCSLKEWWAEFIGVTSRAALTCPGIPKDPVAGAVAWLKHSLAPTLSALKKRYGNDKFIDMIDSSEPELRYTQKHLDIIERELTETKDDYTAADLWNSYLPDVVLLRIQEMNINNRVGEQLEIL